MFKTATQMDAEERKLYNLDQVAKNIILKTVDNVVMGKTRYCRTANAIWDILAEMCEEYEQIRESKLQTALA